MEEPSASRESLATPLVLALAIGAAIAYALVWTLLEGANGCGPPGHSTSGRLLSAAPFALPLFAALVLLAVAVKLEWRLRAAVSAVFATVVTAGVLEVGVLLLEFGAHHCGE